MLRLAGDVALYAAGFVFAALATPNVPGAVDLAGETLELTGTGTSLFMLGVLAWVSVFFRRGSPLAPLIAGAVLAVIGTDYLLLLVGAHHALISWPARRRRQVSVVVGIVVLAFTARELLTSWGDSGMIALVARSVVEGPPSPGVVEVLTLLVAALSLLACFGSAALVRTRRESRAERDRADLEHDRASALSTELNRRSERERLARDIHDALAHRLSVISLQSGALEEATRSQDETVAKTAHTLRQQAHASLDDLRGLLGELRRETGASREQDAAVPPSMASMRTIGHLIRSVRENGTLVDAFVLIEDAEQAGAALDRTVYRIVQESLTNTLRHAPGAPVAVYIEAAASTGVRIRVSNPVTGAPQNALGAGRGLNGIRERAILLGGTAWIGESAGQFIVDVTLPWPDAE